MSRGKYARKHQRELEKSVNESQQSPLLDDIFDGSYNFISKFKTLDTDTQLEIVRLLHNIVKKEENSPSSGEEKHYAEDARYFLNNIYKLAGCSYDKNNFYPLATDEKRLIRMECYGTINRRKDCEISFLYKYFRKNAQPEKYPQSSYKLLASPSWKVFHQFESFRSIEMDIRKHLHKMGIHPDALRVMTVSDFCDVIYQAYKKDENDIVANFLPKTDCIKSKQNKAIMKYAGKEFEALLMKRCTSDGKQIDERAVKAYCDMMRRFGCDDLGSLVITERNYTQRILEGPARNELINFGIDVTTLKVGMPIPQEFIDHMVDNNKADLILAYDEKDKPVSKDGLPQTQYHHNHSVMLARKEDTIASCNYPNNGVNVEVRVHQDFLHRFDKVIHTGVGVEQISARLNIQDKNMRVLLGLNAEKDALYCDFENTPEFRRRKVKDLKCKVNYFNMMQVRMQNEAKIIEKHQIHYSRSYIQEGYRNLREIENTEDYNKAAMREIRKLLKAKHIARKKGRGR